MKHTIHDLQQGGHEWKAHRNACHNASELAAAAGESKYKSRNDLVRELAIGAIKEVDAATQRRFDDGHRFEALARPLAEEIMSGTLYPITVSVAVDGLGRRLSASLDGALMDDSANFEHKHLNAELSSALDQGIIPPEYRWQMEQGMAINGATRTLFMASEWDDGDNLIAEKHCWYESNPELSAKIVPIWRQLEEDVAAYRHVEVIPAAVAAPVEGFGALVLQVEGRVTACNLDAFQAGAQAFLDRLPKADELETDQNFADAEAAAKACSEAESKIKAAKAAAMAQAASIDEVFRAVDHISDLIRTARLWLDNTVKKRKEQLRAEIIGEGQAALSAHIDALNERLGKPYMPPVPADFAAAIKGMKKLDNMRDAIADTLARAKIEANSISDRIERNLAHLRTEAKDYEFLFADVTQILLKAPDDFAALVKMRIEEHKSRQVDQRGGAQCVPSISEAGQGTAHGLRQEQAATPDNGLRIRLGAINSAISPLSITSAGLEQLGVPHVGTDKAAKLYRQCDLALICRALAKHLEDIAASEVERGEISQYQSAA